MEHRDAVSLIRNGVNGQSFETWADVGAGHGVFTLALADCLGRGGTIYAFDQDRGSLNSIPGKYNGVDIVKVVGDINAVTIPEGLDGIVMANTLHFFSDGSSLLTRLGNSVHPAGVILIVEYDTRQSSQWIPHPVPYADLILKAEKIGYTTRRLMERPSIYGNWNIYSAILESSLGVDV